MLARTRGPITDDEAISIGRNVAGVTCPDLIHPAVAPCDLAVDSHGYGAR